MAVLLDVVVLAWLDEMLRNFLWVPLSSYAKELELNLSFLGVLFAVNVGSRFFPNFLVTRLGSRAEVPLMVAVFVGYAVAYARPTEPWALQLLSVCSGFGFVRPCVTLRAQAACAGDIDRLSDASRHCGAARTLADVCSFVLPAAVFQMVGWSGVTSLGAALAVLYIVVALPRHLQERAAAANAACALGADEESLVERSDCCGSIPWIDWVLAGAFVSTELQWNLLNTAVPAALLHSFDFSAASIGLITGSGCVVALVYLLALPALPKAFNQHRPLNLLITYFGMALAWGIMLTALAAIRSPQLFVLGTWVFLAMANASQVVLLECLTGVCSLESSTKIMGVSEMVGCAFGMAGSYSGEALMHFGMAMPFCMCGGVSFLSVLILALSLGFRRSEISRRVACSTVRHEYSLATPRSLPADGSDLALVSSVRGLHSILIREDSYITEEVTFREGRDAGGADLAANGDGCSDCGDGTFSIASSDDLNYSCSRARRMKRLASGFEFAFPELDKEDHEVAEKHCMELGVPACKLTRFRSHDNILPSRGCVRSEIPTASPWKGSASEAGTPPLSKPLVGGGGGTWGATAAEEGSTEDDDRKALLKSPPRAPSVAVDSEDF